MPQLAESKIVSLYMPRTLDEKLEEFAAGQDRSKSYVMRRLLEQALTEEGMESSK
jgi:predicted transcriptional regulator